MSGARLRRAATFSFLFSLAVLAALALACPDWALAVEYRYVAHQGKVTKDYRGNTLPAFEQAASAPGIFGIETDIWRTADGRYVCLHGEDADSDSGSDGDLWAGMVIWDTDLAALKAKRMEGYELPTLDQYLDICKAGGKYAFIEIKNHQLAEDESYAHEVVKIVHDHGMLDQCVFVSWIGRSKSVYFLKEAARADYGAEVLGHTGSGRTNEKVDEAIGLAKEYGLDGVGTYPGIAQQDYAFEQLQGTGIVLRSSGALKSEERARSMGEKYDLWAIYCEFEPKNLENVVCGIEGLGGSQPVVSVAVKAEESAHIDKSDTVLGCVADYLLRNIQALDNLGVRLGSPD